MLIRLVVRLEPCLSFVGISAQADVLVNVSNVVMDYFRDDCVFHCACAVDRIALPNVWTLIQIFIVLPSRCRALFRYLNLHFLRRRDVAARFWGRISVSSSVRTWS